MSSLPRGTLARVPSAQPRQPPRDARAAVSTLPVTVRAGLSSVSPIGGPRVPHRTARRARLLAAVLTVGTLVALLARRPVQAATPVRGAGPGHRLVRDDGGRVRLLAARCPLRRRCVDLAVTAARATSTGSAGRSASPRATCAPSGAAGSPAATSCGSSRPAAGLPVLGGQLVMVLDGRRRAAVGVRRDRRAGHLHGVRRRRLDAARTARRATAAHHGVSRRSLRADRPTRWLLDRSLLDRRATPGLRPVWRVPVRSAARAGPARPGARRRAHRAGSRCVWPRSPASTGSSATTSARRSYRVPARLRPGRGRAGHRCRRRRPGLRPDRRDRGLVRRHPGRRPHGA